MNTKICFEARDVTLERGRRLLFCGLGFSLEKGTLLRLAGPNGAGKTSLLRVLCGLAQAQAGQILFNGTPIGEASELFHADLMYLGHLNGVKGELTVRENLRFAYALEGQKADEKAITDAIARIGLAGYEDRLAAALSQGQKRRVALSRLFLFSGKTIWLLDEPFTALDVASVAQLAETIAEHVRAGGIVIYTTHQDVAIDVPEGASRCVDISAFAPEEDFDA